MNIIGNAILAVWYVPEKVKFSAYFFGFWSWSQGSMFYPSHNDILRKDVSGSYHILGQQSNSWVSKLLTPTVDSPKFHKGFTGTAWSTNFFMAWGLWFYKRDERRDAHENDIIVYNSKKDETPEDALPIQGGETEHDSSSLLVDSKNGVKLFVSSLTS